MTDIRQLQERGQAPAPDAAGTGRIAAALAAVSGVAVLVANLNGLAIGDDGVGYWATADSLVEGRGLRYFLEDPLTVWPPGWPSLMALLDVATPLTTYGAAIALNTVVAVLMVLVVHALLRRLVADRTLVLAGTAVAALGPSIIGLGHLLMTDQAFALVVATWILALIRWHDRTGFEARAGVDALALAVGLVWCAFLLRYVGVVLIPVGALWFLLDLRRSLLNRMVTAMVYVTGAALVPVVWMLRNQEADGTMFGPRWSSARGLVDNGFDVLATLGRFILPGVADGWTKPWAVVGGLAFLGAAALGAELLRRKVGEPATPGRFIAGLVTLLGSPSGLPLYTAGAYLAYMLYQRSSVALNQLDLRLLNPAYLPLLVATLVLIDRALATGDARFARLRTVAVVWAAANVVVGLGAVALFASDDDFLLLNYERQGFDELRATPTIEALPEDCERLYSNLPNALYAAGLGAHWSPRTTALESNDPLDDLTPLRATVGRIPTCLVWFELHPEDPARPTYGNLYRLDELGDVFRLEPIDRSELPGGEAVATYRMLPTG